MSKETYMTGFNKMASACGVEANKLLCILGGNRRGGAHSIKSAQDGSGSKGLLANLGEAISSKWNGLTDNEKTLALGLAGAGGGGLLGAGIGKLTGFGTGKGAITGALLGGVGGAGYGMYSKEQKRLLGEIAKQKQEHASDTAKRDKAHAEDIANLNNAHAQALAKRDDEYASGNSQMQARIDQQQKEMEQKAKAYAAAAEKAQKAIAERDGTIDTLRSIPSITNEEYVRMSPEERKNVNSSMDWFIDKYTTRKDELKWAAIKDKKVKELAAKGYTPEQINAMLANSRPDTIEWNIANFNDKLDALKEQDRKINDKNSAEAQKLREAIEKYEALIRAYQELGSKRSNMAGNAVPSPGNAKKIGR